MKKRILALLLCMVMCLSTVSLFAGCGGKSSKPDALVLMSEELDGLFNPFFSTTAADGTIVSMTQIGMITNSYINGEIGVAFGDDQATVVKDYQSKGEDLDGDGKIDETTYLFVIKNGILFSDGKPLTMNDVMFNLYVYLDPVYTGSSTMYSTDIKGLLAYRTQEHVDDSGDSDTDSVISQTSLSMAQDRINELINLFYEADTNPSKDSYEADYNTMISAIENHTVNPGYISAIFTEAEIESMSEDEIQTKARAQLKADYERARKLFNEELEKDFASAKEAFTEEPYKSAPVKFDEILSFMYAEGYVRIEYAEGADGKKDRTKIDKVIPNYGSEAVYDKASAIKYVYDDKISSKLDEILSYWATANTLTTEFSAKAKEVLLTSNATANNVCPNPDCGLENELGTKYCAECNESLLTIPTIEGIVSLGHKEETKGTTIEVNGTEYTVATDHNADGTVKNADEYDVLSITINGVDPKAVWNFAFAVAPQHYYAPNQVVDLERNRFGVDYGSFDFMSYEIQSTRNVKVPMGAGAYQATNLANDTNNYALDADKNNLASTFSANNVVCFKRNDNFNTVGNLENAKIEKVRYQVVSATNALTALAAGEIHYASPQYTPYNMEQLEKLKKDGIVSMSTDQLGYGYIGINAGKVQSLELRKAIMCAMDISLGKRYYVEGTADTIYWPMSLVSWAYPTQEDGVTPDRDNMHSEYIAVQFSVEAAKEQILYYMSQVPGLKEGDERLKLTFTIAGADVDDHPCYSIFDQAAKILNDCGWDIQVVPDTQALTKLSTGSLTVWAAAWGSTIDPDMYQVYHKNSTATSVLAWGYNKILENQGGEYDEENDILNDLSDVIDAARETEDQEIRKELYKEAMGYVLDLAVELPVYQRDVLYAYNSSVIKSESLPSQSELNPYSSPLDRIWELEFAE